MQALNALRNRALSVLVPIKLVSSNFHTSLCLSAWTKPTGPRMWLRKNKLVFPPQEENEERRPAFVCHQITNIKYSPDKMWYVASLVRGMTADEAVRQLSFVHKKGAVYVKQAILEAQEKAVLRHNVEFKSNLWVAESFCSKGIVIKGRRRHAKGRYGEVRYIYTHYFVKLEEGTPPADYYGKNLPTPQKQLDDWIEEMRKRKVINSL